MQLLEELLKAVTAACIWLNHQSRATYSDHGAVSTRSG